MRDRTVPGEIVITGAPVQVARLIERAQLEGLHLVERQAFTVDRVTGQIKLALVALKGGPHNADLTMTAIQRLMGWAGAEKLEVSAEPNSATGNPRATQGSPWQWEGSPWQWEGSPWEWEGGSTAPKAVVVGSTPAEGETLFWKQGAFQQISLTNADGQRLPILETHQGEGVVAGVFDTLPAGPVTLPWLTVHPAQGPITATAPEPIYDYADHGLLNASLLHAVAPKVQVHLYEVLNKDATGALFPLLFGINDFVTLAGARPGVINLSLGGMLWGSSSPSLQTLLQVATDRGMVVCAAAGNRSKKAPKAADIPQAQVPACFANVIAVAACNAASVRASYSQRGDIAAPGGEDKGAPGPGDEEDIIGMGVSSPTGYLAMDAGTSFSTPMVTGTAALVLADLVAKGTVPGPNTYAQVLAGLKTGAHLQPAGPETLNNSGLGAGIIDIPSALGLVG